MDPISLIASAAVAGTSIIGTKAVEKSVEELWNRFKERFQKKVVSQDSQTTSLHSMQDVAEVKASVASSGAANDPELIDMAQQLNKAFQQLDATQYQQIAQKIINIQINYGSITIE
jgi:hypothetical protein